MSSSATVSRLSSTNCNDSLDAAYGAKIPAISERAREFLCGLNEILEAALPEFCHESGEDRVCTRLVFVRNA